MSKIFSLKTYLSYFKTKFHFVLLLIILLDDFNQKLSDITYEINHHSHERNRSGHDVVIQRNRSYWLSLNYTARQYYFNNSYRQNILLPPS